MPQRVTAGPVFPAISIVTLLTLIIFGLSACSGTPTAPDKRLTPQQEALKNTPLHQAQALEREGNYTQAADLYLITARKLSRPDSELWRAKAAEMYWKAGQLVRAEQIISATDQTVLSTVDRAHVRILSARIARQKKDYRGVTSQLDFPIQTLPRNMQKQILALQYQAYQQLGNKKAQAKVLMHRLNIAKSMNDSEKLWAMLTEMPVAELSKWLEDASETRDATTRGWVELAYIAKTTGYNPESLESALLRWEQSYRNHPAAPDRIQAIRAQRQNLAINTSSIAVILPVSGPYASVAQAVLDGIMAAQLGNPSAGTRIQVYDSGNLADQVLPLYQRAVAEGANLVIGPMNKDAVDALAMQRLPVPVIALNYGKNPTTQNPNLFQFALLPEDEATQAAEKIWHDGFTRAVAFVPQGPWGKRTADAFTAQFQELGGTVADIGAFDPKKSDASDTIKKTLGVTEKGHREDVDAIFIAATPKQARLLKPLFRFHRSGDLPVYATSTVYTGHPNPGTDGDLNGIIFTESPWLLGLKSNTPLQQQIPTPEDLEGPARQIPRLFAFGFDSYTIAPKVRELASSPLLKVKGLSGDIYTDNTNHLHRITTWAKFVRGKPQVIETGLDSALPAQ